MAQLPSASNRYARRLAALCLLLGTVRCTGRKDDAAQRKAAWDKEVAADKAKTAILVSPGKPPLQKLTVSLSLDQELVADITVESTVKVHRDGGPEMTRISTVNACMHIRAHQPKGDEAPIAFEVTDLTSTALDLEGLPRTGVIEPGAHGEPWMLVLNSPASGNRGLVWQRDVAGWARRVLMPVPPEPIGVGASWRRSWDDYFGYEKTTEAHQYTLVSIGDASVKITAQATTQAFASAVSGSGSSTATIELPLGGRAVPTSEWTQQGTADIIERGQVTHLVSTTITKVRPHVAGP